jgi:phi13 family phage major tail protein
MPKVQFGISNLHIGTYTEVTTTTGTTVTLGTPYHQKGAVSFSPEVESSTNDFYADNIVYWSGYSGGKIEGDLEVAMFDDSFKTQFLGYKTLTSGGLANVKNPTKPNVYIAFESNTDESNPLRVILYNCTLGNISRAYETITDTKEPKTATLPVTCIGDNTTGVTMAVFKQGDSGYASLFTSPSAPVISTT